MKKALLFAAVVFLPFAALAADDTGWYVIRPGDTLEAITALSLGDHTVWRENHTLNPEIRNPDLVFPGQRIRVRLVEGIPLGAALLTQISRSVEEQPAPNAWQEAQERDLLRQRDGVRTAGDSSAVLRFGDGTDLTMSEDSLLFLHGEGAATQRSRRRGAVQIVVGQADLTGAALPPEASPVEIVLGGASARPSPGSDGSVATRARLQESGDAQVMVYEGTGKVTAAGTEVALAAGTGSAVPASGPPRPPEKLLSAPKAESPTPAARLGAKDPAFRWAALEAAAAYTLEVCEDQACGRLVARRTDLRQTETKAGELPPGTYFWRVTATSESGLDGFPSIATSFEIVDDPSLLEPPQATIRTVGVAAAYAGAVALPVASRLAIDIVDPAGDPEFRPTVDGQVVSPDAFASGWNPGSHTVGGTVYGAAGTEIEITPVEIILDPAGPELSWEVGGLELLDRRGMDQGRKARKPRGKASKATVVISPDGRSWSPLVEEGAQTATHDVKCDDPQLFLWAREEVELPDRTVPKDRVVRLEATDELTSVRQLQLQVLVEDDLVRLTLTATDLVGNQSSREWSSSSP